jgi:hypothetical protein
MAYTLVTILTLGDGLISVSQISPGTTLSHWVIFHYGVMYSSPAFRFVTNPPWSAGPT